MLCEIPNVGLIRHAGSYHDAMVIIKEQQPRILLLDINLPDKSGIEILRSAKENNPSATVIMITNQANEYYQKLCLKLGADYFVDKSKEFDQISGIINGLD